jgi:hypothetical protein
MTWASATTRQRAVAGVCLAALAARCGGGGDSSPPPGKTARPSASIPRSRISPVKTTCPPDITGGNRSSVCKVAQVSLPLSHCSDSGPGGYDVLVSGISCEEGRSLRRPFVHFFRHVHDVRESVYSVWTARGPLGHLVPVKATRWRCWAGLDPEGSVGIWHACWRGSGLLLFKFG